MSKRYRVTHAPHYIGQRMVYPDSGAESIITLQEGVKPGRWLVPLDDAPASATLFVAKHVGGGHYHVERVADSERASVVFKRTEGDAMAKAEAEAARLNAGGEIYLGVMDDDSSSAQEDLPAGALTGDVLPDA